MVVEIFSFFDTPVKVVLPDSTERISGEIISGDMILSNPIVFDADLDHYRNRDIHICSFDISIDDLKKCKSVTDVIKYSKI